MSAIKLEVNQIWKCENGHIRRITYLGKRNVMYEILMYEILSSGTKDDEACKGINSFYREYAHELLPCWPPVPELKELTAGFHATISVNKEGDLVISKSTVDNLIAAYKTFVE